MWNNKVGDRVKRGDRYGDVVQASEDYIVVKWDGATSEEAISQNNDLETIVVTDA
jgi:hypothetical protein